MKIWVHNVVLNLLDDNTYEVVLGVIGQDGITTFLEMKPRLTLITINKNFKISQKEQKEKIY